MIKAEYSTYEHNIERLLELTFLPDGWYDHEQGLRISNLAIKRVYNELRWIHFTHQPIPQPFIYPTIEGGLSLEWQAENEFYWTIEINFAGNSFLHTYPQKSENEEKMYEDLRAPIQRVVDYTFNNNVQWKFKVGTLEFEWKQDKCQKQ